MEKLGKMKIYSILIENKNFFYSPINYEDFFSISSGNYNLIDNIGADFKRIINSDSFLGDFTWCDNSSILLLKKTLTEEPIFKNIKYLPLKNDSEYYIICPNCIDCLDLEKSKISYFKNSKKIMSIDKYVFQENFISDDELFFKIKLLNYSPIFCTEKFVDFYKKNKLTGLVFKRIF